MNHKASRISINCTLLPCPFSLFLSLYHFRMMVYVSIYIYLHAYAPPHSGSRVTGELEETSAVVDRSLVLLPAALCCVSLFATYKKVKTVLNDTNALKAYSTENSREKKIIRLARFDLAETRKSHFRTLSTSYKSQKCNNHFPSPLYFRFPPLLSLPVRCEMKLSHARNSRSRFFPCGH